ncbi:2'-5'-oligoadenylate synthase 1A-like [Dendronephthya gigantea]|nr:2'-5'-oligoadenylate synthase 1A-like [Dendronephthya gigantea]
MATIVDDLCEFLRRQMRPSQIIKGGSLGKGTSVRGRCDMDLVMILNGVHDAEDLRRQLPAIKGQIKDTLGRYSGNITIVPDSLTDKRFHVKFSVESRLGEIDVDLLPTFKYEDLHNHYRNLTNDEAENIAFYSVSLVERRVNFVKDRRPNVKNLIRLVKYWKKEMVRSDKRIPNSYLMELITIHLWEKNGSCDVFNMLKAFHSVMKALENYSRLNVFWTTNYFESEIPYEVLCERPLVLDPSNPTNNVCSEFEWDDIQREAIKVLRSPMLEDVSSTSWK